MFQSLRLNEGNVGTREESSSWLWFISLFMIDWLPAVTKGGGEDHPSIPKLSFAQVGTYGCSQILDLITFEQPKPGFVVLCDTRETHFQPEMSKLPRGSSQPQSSKSSRCGGRICTIFKNWFPFCSIDNKPFISEVDKRSTLHFLNSYYLPPPFPDWDIKLRISNYSPRRERYLPYAKYSYYDFLEISSYSWTILEWINITR